MEWNERRNISVRGMEWRNMNGPTSFWRIFIIFWRISSPQTTVRICPFENRVRTPRNRPTGGWILRTDHISKTSIKFNFASRKKSCPFLKRSRSKEFWKTFEKNLRVLKIFLKLFYFIFRLRPELNSQDFKNGIRFLP